MPTALSIHGSIDCTSVPVLPRRLMLAGQQQFLFPSKLYLSSGRFELYRIPAQEMRGSIEGRFLKALLLASQPTIQVLPVHVMQFFIDHPEMSPEAWRSRDEQALNIFFWATECIQRTRESCVCGISWNGNAFRPIDFPLSYEFRVTDPAAIWVPYG